jgi:phenylacetate-CoA ligase
MNERARVLLTAVSVRRHDTGSPQKIERFQNRKLRQIVTHAYRNVPYYKSLFDKNGLRPSDIRTVADLDRIPITRKSEIRGLPMDELLAKGTDRNRLFSRTTSGVTGEPFTIWRTPREELLLSAMFLRRELRALGVRRGDRVALVKAHSRARSAPAPRRENALSVALRRALIREAGTENVQHVNAFSPLDEIVEKLRKANPSVISGYPGILARIAQYVELTAAPDIRPRIVITGAEVLTAAMRQQIARGFVSRVYDTYGSAEFGRIATECVETGEYHICDDSVIVELLADGKPVGEGDTGTLIGTNLHSYAMPFIRFELGDLAVKGRDQCTCGSPFGTLRGVIGRTIDTFYLPDGTEMHPWTILDAIWSHIAGWMAQYRFVQETPVRIVMSVVPRRAPSSAELVDLNQRVRKVLGRKVEFCCQLVDEIETDKSGKSRTFRSLVHAGND